MSQWVENGALHVDVDINIKAPVIEVDTDDFLLDIEFGIGGGGGTFPYYDGPYEVDPRKVEQILATKDKSMKDDVIINPIYYAETSNLSGGLTAVIGME